MLGITLASSIALAASPSFATLSAIGPTGYGRPTSTNGVSADAGEATPGEAEAGAATTNYSTTVWTVSGANLLISGSTTCYPILNAAMPGFVSAQAALGNNVVPDLKQGGSGVGRTDGGLGLNDLAASSSAFKTPADGLSKAKWGTQDVNHNGLADPTDVTSAVPMWDVTKIARDGVVVIINDSVNAASINLTKAQITAIYGAYKPNGSSWTLKSTAAGDAYNGIINWNQVGGPNKSIVPIAREVGGGTRTSFDDFIGVSEGDEVATINATGNHRFQGNPGVVAAANANDGSANGAIAYCGLGFTTGLSHVNEMNVNGIAPTKQNVYGLTYPFSRFLQVATLHGWTNPRTVNAQNAQKFEQYLWTEPGQDAVATADFLKLWPDVDVNKDGNVDITDVAGVGMSWMQTNPTGHWIRADVNGDGSVDITDVAAIGMWWMFGYALP